MANLRTLDVTTLRDNVAAALDLSPRHVSLRSSRLSPGARSVRAWGDALGRPFFAKTLLADPYPLMPQVAIPWDDAAFGTIFRSAEEQIEAEWSMTQQLRRLTGADAIALPMGRSLMQRTIVWQDLGGARMDDRVKRLHLGKGRIDNLAGGLEQAGRWLQLLHQHSAHGSAMIDLNRIAERLQDRISQGDQPLSRHGRTALRILERAFRNCHRGELTVPVVLAHGDFMLSNLLWDRRALHVVDYENCAPAPLYQDILTLVFNLRSQLLNPLIPRRAIRSLEKAFWTGYGPVAEEVVLFVHAIASARLLYYHLPKALGKRLQGGGVSRAMASVYKTFLAPAMVARCLEGM